MLQPSWADASNQIDLPRIKKVAQTVSSRQVQSLEVPLEPECRGVCHGCKYAQLDEFFKQVAQSREELIRQCSIQESEKVIDKWYYMLTWQQ